MGLLPSFCRGSAPRRHGVATSGHRWPHSAFFPAPTGRTQGGLRRVGARGGDAPSCVGGQVSQPLAGVSLPPVPHVRTVGTGQAAAVRESRRGSAPSAYSAPPRVTPPSIVSVWPVTHDASELSRKLTAPATSSGRPRRFIG